MFSGERNTKLCVVTIMLCLTVAVYNIRLQAESSFQANVECHLRSQLILNSSNIITMDDAENQSTAHIDNTVKEDESGPLHKVAWLMSFPNSGTSFTTRMIRHVTKMSSATNYAKESHGQDGKPIPIFEQGDDGPFWVDPRSFADFERPTKYVLTKTHCGGRCSDCKVDEYMETPKSFLHECLSGSIRDDSTTAVRTISYDAAIVGKAIHLIRNPFDNMVSRLHLVQKREHIGEGGHAVGKKHEVTRDGFRAHCQLMADKYADDEANSSWVFGKSMYDELRRVPCYADFFRYIQWHNNAHLATQELDIPTYIVHYESFAKDFNGTVSGILHFLEQPMLGELFEFIAGKEYSHFYTRDERQILGTAAEQWSLPTTWNVIGHYFDDL